MITFPAFETAAPSVARPIRRKIEEAGLMMLATIRKDGSPRISPIETLFVEGGLYFGSMPEAQKARDLARDPRCALITPVVDRKDMGGDGKLFAVARRLEPADADRILRASAAENDFDAEELAGSPCYEVMITGAAWQYLDGEKWTTRSWREGAPERVRARAGALGLPEDVA